MTLTGQVPPAIATAIATPPEFDASDVKTASTDPTRGRRRPAWAASSIKLVKGLVWGVIAAWSVLLLAWLTLHWAILPHIAQWRVPIELRASAALGIPVRIGGIVVSSSGWVPTLELANVALLDPRGQPALKLPRVVAALSPRSLLSMLSLRLRFEQLLIDGAELEVRRDASGRILVAGLDFSAATATGQGQNRAAADWFFDQREFVVRGGALRWVDELRGAPPLALADVQLVVRNSLRGHEMRLDATPPAAWGERFSLRGLFTHSLLAGRGDWRHWSGSAYAELPRADVSQLRRHVALPFDLSQGDGALRAWLDLRDGQPQGATVDVALRAVSLRLVAPAEPAEPAPALGKAAAVNVTATATAADTLAPLEFQRVEGRLVGRLGAGGGSVALQRFGFVTADGVVWPRSDAALSWQNAADRPDALFNPGNFLGNSAGNFVGNGAGGEFKADRLDLALMSQVATRLPLGAALRELLAELKPEGVMSAVQARWRGPLDAPAGYSVTARLDGLSLASHAAHGAGNASAVGRPGLRNAGVQLSATEKGGEATLTIAQGSLDLPGVFAEPVVPLERWSSRVAWQIEPVLSKGAAKSVAPLPPKLTLQVKDARFANADAAGELRAAWSTGAVAVGAGTGSVTGTGAGKPAHERLPGVLELDGRLTRGDATRVARYLPLGIPAETRRYVDQAVRAGTLANVAFRVKGDLAEFPFGNARRAKDGEFRIAGQVQDATFAFVPSLPASGTEAAFTSPWPALTALAGELIFDRSSMEIRNAQARLGGVALKGVQGGIRNLAEHPVLVLEGGGKGALAEMLRFVDSTPVGGWTGKALAQARASGTAELKLALAIPLAEVDKSTVKGSVTLAGNELRLTADAPPLTSARGRIDFSDKGFSVAAATARLLGGEINVDGGSQPDGAMRFNASGSVTAEALRRTPELGTLTRAAGTMSGQARWRGTLAVLRGRSEIDLGSNLVGLAFDLPAPLRKAAETPLALRVQTKLLPDAVAVPAAVATGTAGASASVAATPAQRDTLRVELGSLVQAFYVRDLSGDVPRVLRGGIGVQEPPPLPVAGVAANLNLFSVNVDAWEALAARLSGSAAAANTAPMSAAAPTGAAGVLPSNAPFGDYGPTTLALRVQDLTLGGRRLARVVAGASFDDGLWRANIESDRVGGYIEYRAPRRGGFAAAAGALGGTPGGASATALAAAPAAPNAPGRVFARLSHLSVPKSDGDESDLLQGTPTTSVPSLDIAVDELELRGKRLGKVEVEAVNRWSGEGRDAVREWRLNRLTMVTPDARLTASGNWTPVGASSGAGAGQSPAVPGVPAPRRRTVMNFKLDMTDSGAFLDRLGLGRTVRGGKGVMSGQVAWLGSPLAIDYPSLSGQMNLAVDAGQFLKAEPGAARLLSVLSLQALPRRLLLDFRDVFQQGFAFDSISGDLKIAQGVAQSRNLRMRGVQATVAMAGSANLALETQDLRVVVVPEVNAGTASLAYAAINPALGIGTFVAQLLLRKPLMAAGTREFHIGGSWAEPKVDKVERSITDALPDLDLPALPMPAPPSTPSPADEARR